jgi:hypothetical protein
MHGTHREFLQNWKKDRSFEKGYIPLLHTRREFQQSVYMYIFQIIRTIGYIINGGVYSMNSFVCLLLFCVCDVF